MKTEKKLSHDETIINAIYDETNKRMKVECSYMLT
jgi:hypothetical protein